MTIFDDRAKGFENKFAHDEMIGFQAKARRNKLMANWAATLLDLSGAAKSGYVTEIAKLALTKSGEQAIVHRIKSDLNDRGVALTEQELEVQFDRFMAEAQQVHSAPP